jgi:hypothetical protein
MEVSNMKASDTQKPAREKIILESLVKFDKRGFQHHDIKNVSMSGVFVLANDGTLTKLTANSPVEVALKMRTNGTTKTHVFKARVTSVNSEGAQLSFSDADVDAYSALLHLGVRSS